MLTYTLDAQAKIPLYEQLYRAIKTDITKGVLRSQDKLPSKRSLAKHLGVSIVTVETSYQQLKAEGYIYSQAKKRLFCSRYQVSTSDGEKNSKVSFSSKNQVR